MVVATAVHTLVGSLASAKILCSLLGGTEKGQMSPLVIICVQVLLCKCLRIIDLSETAAIKVLCAPSSESAHDTLMVLSVAPCRLVSARRCRTRAGTHMLVDCGVRRRMHPANGRFLRRS
jgi:hypothetical protein